MKKTFLLILFVSAIAVQAQNRAIEFRDLTWSETLKTSKKESKPIFIDCYTTWCGPCKWMSANIFTNDKVADYYNQNYICVKFDMEKGEGKELASKFKIRAYPTLIYADANEEILLVSVGASQEPKSYITNGKRAKDPKDNLPYYIANKEENFGDSKFMSNYFDVMTSANRVNQEEVNKYFAQFKPEEWASETNWSIIQNTIRSSNNDVFKTIVENDKLYIDKYGEEAEDFITNIYFYDLANQFYRAKSEDQKTAYQEHKKEVLAGSFSGRDFVDYKLNSFEYQQTKNWDSYCEINAMNVDNYYADNANELNSIAWNFFENTENKEYLTAALKWAKKASELEPKSHAILDTYANLLFVTGSSLKALEVETKALELAKSEGSDTGSYQELIDTINKSILLLNDTKKRQSLAK